MKTGTRVDVSGIRNLASPKFGKIISDTIPSNNNNSGIINSTEILDNSLMA